MSKLSKLRDAIEHLEAAEALMLDARRAFGQFTLQYDSLTYHADHASKAADAVRSTLSQVEFGIYQAAQHSVQRTVSHVHEKGVICPACHGEETDTPFTVHHH